MSKRVSISACVGGVLLGVLIGGSVVMVWSDYKARGRYPIDMPVEDVAQRKEELFSTSVATESLVIRLLYGETGGSTSAATLQSETALMIAQYIGDADKRVLMIPTGLAYSAGFGRSATARAVSLFACELYVRLVAYRGLKMVTNSVRSEDDESLRALKRKQIQIILYGAELPDGLAEMSDDAFVEHCVAEINRRRNLLEEATVRNLGVDE